MICGITPTLTGLKRGKQTAFRVKTLDIESVQSSFVNRHNSNRNLNWLTSINSPPLKGKLLFFMTFISI